MTEDTKTLRDEFAMAALRICLKDFDASYSTWAAEAYSLADAMMAERAKSSPALNEGER